MNFWKDKRVLVTGHTGFKGSWLSFWLAKLGATVCGFALEPDSEPNMFTAAGVESKLHSVIADIRNPETLDIIVTEFEPDVVFHLAAQSLVRRSYREPAETFATNLMGTVNVLEAVRNAGSVKSVVVVTTDKVYENEERLEPYSEGEPLGGFDPYSSSKACAEIAASAYRRSFFQDTGCLIATARAGNVIGGGDWCEDRLVPDIFRSVIAGEELVIRNPDSVRPWQHVLEPLSGYMMLAEKLASGDAGFAEAWNFGPSTKDSRAVGEVLDLIKSVWGDGVNFEYSDSEQPHEAGMLVLDSSKAAEQLGWKPKLNLEDAVTLTVEWYRAFADEKDLTEITNKQIEYYAGK